MDSLYGAARIHVAFLCRDWHLIQVGANEVALGIAIDGSKHCWAQRPR